MLTSAKVHPTLPAVDLDRAKEFYVGKLGLRVIGEDPSPGAVLQAGDGTSLYIYQREATKAEHTVASFTVEDVEAAVKELKSRGVDFQDIDMPGLKTVDGVAAVGGIKAAWFTDSEGNILGVTNM